MKRECVELQNAILKNGQVIDDLSVEQLQHAEQCPDCQKLLQESNYLLAAVKYASTTPSSPDCRAAVLEQIKPRAIRRLVLVYALVTSFILILFAVAAWQLGIKKPASSRDLIATKVPGTAAPVPKSIEEPKKLDIILPEQKKTTDIPKNTSKPDKSINKRPDYRKIQPKQEKFVPVPTLEPADEQKNIVEHKDMAPATEPVAVASNNDDADFVEWVEEQPVSPTEYIRRYTILNNKTGEICSWVVHVPVAEPPSNKPDEIDDSKLIYDLYTEPVLG